MAEAFLERVIEPLHADTQRLLRVQQRVARAAALLPDRTVARGSLPTVPRVALRSDGSELQLPRDIAQLDALAHASSVGKGAATLVEPAARASRSIARERVDVRGMDWPAVFAQLAAIAPGTRFEAHLHEVVLYRAGGGFRMHRDAEKRPGHRLTLSVDIGSSVLGERTAEGGAMRFATVDDMRALREERPLCEAYAGEHSQRPWASAAGEWAAWPTSLFHKVEEVTAGTRVVAVFAIVCEPLATASELFPNAPALDGVAPFPKLVWEAIADACDLATLGRLLATCTRMHSVVGGRAAPLVRLLRDNADFLRSELRAWRWPKIAFVLRHGYFLEEAGRLSARHLKGCDRLIGEALHKLGWLSLDEPAVQGIVLEREVETEMGAEQQVRVGVGIVDEETIGQLLQFEDDRAYNDWPKPDAVAKEKRLWETINDMLGTSNHDLELSDITHTIGDLDYPHGSRVVPFVGTLVFAGQFATEKVFIDSYSFETDSLWGNQRVFGLKAYRASAIVVKLVDIDQPESVTKSLADNMNMRWIWMNRPF